MVLDRLDVHVCACTCVYTCVSVTLWSHQSQCSTSLALSVFNWSLPNLERGLPDKWHTNYTSPKGIAQCACMVTDFCFTTWYLTSRKSAPSVSPYHTCPVAFRSLSALEQLQGPHHQWHIRCLSGVWSGTTLRRASVQLSKQHHATHSARFVGWPGRGRRLPQPG